MFEDLKPGDLVRIRVYRGDVLGVLVETWEAASAAGPVVGWAAVRLDEPHGRLLAGETAWCALAQVSAAPVLTPCELAA